MFPEFNNVGIGLRHGDEMVNSMQYLPLWSLELSIYLGYRGIIRSFQHSTVRGKGQVPWDPRGRVLTSLTEGGHSQGRLPRGEGHWGWALKEGGAKKDKGEHVTSRVSKEFERSRRGACGD